MANFITGLRIVFSIALLFCSPLSFDFYAVYIAAGITDMSDGLIARKTNTSNDFGSRFDTAADFVFLVSCLIKLAPILNIDTFIYIWIVIIALIRAVNIVLGYLIHQKLVTLHSVMNKVSGAMLFVLPFTLKFIELRYSAIAVCSVATFASVQESFYIRKRKEIKL